MGTFTPRFYPHTMAEQVKFDKSLGLEGMYTEVYTFLPHTAPMIWALAKLQWDASLDIDSLLREFYMKMFGSAAETMSHYFDVLERSWNTPRAGRRGWVHRNIVNQALAISPVALDEAMALLDQAAKQAQRGVTRQRIDTIRAALEYAGYAIRAYALSEQLISTSVTGARQAEQAMNQISRLTQLSANREPFWAAAMKRRDLLGENLRGLAGKGYLMTGHVASLERGSGVGAIRVVGWYADHAPEQLPKVTARLTELRTGGAAELVRAWLWTRDTQPSNLAENGDFEDISGAPTSARKGQPAERTPAAWCTWQASPRARFSAEKSLGRYGSIAARISNAGSAAYFQVHKAQPGQRYLCLAHARGMPADQDTGGALAIRFRRPDETWHPRRDLEPRVQMVAQDGWQPLMVVVTVPEGAGRLVLLLSAKGQPKDAAVLFDDVGLYRLPEEW